MEEEVVSISRDLIQPLVKIVEYSVDTTDARISSDASQEPSTLFVRYDRNGDGVLDVPEVRIMLGSLGIRVRPSVRPSVRNIMPLYSTSIEFDAIHHNICVWEWTRLTLLTCTAGRRGSLNSCATIGTIWGQARKE